MLVYTLMCTGLVLRRCAYRWTRPLGGGRWRYCLRGLLGVHWFPLKMRLEDWRKWWPLRSCEAVCASLGEIAQSMVIKHAWKIGLEEHSGTIAGKS